MTVLATLIARDLRHDPADPHWPDRDRLLLAAPYSGAPPDAAALIGAPCGQALAAAVGLAIAERLLAARFGRSLVDHRIWLQARREDLICGAGREAAHIAGVLGLGRLAVLANLAQDDRALRAGFAAEGWAVRLVEQGDGQAAGAALSACLRVQRPTLILAIGAEAAAEAEPPGTRGPAARRAWLKRLRRHASREAFQHALSGHMPPAWQRACQPDAPPSQGQSAAAAVAASLARLAALLPDLASLPSGETSLPPPPISAFGAAAPEWQALGQATPACVLGMAMHGGLLPICQTSAGGELPRAALRQAGVLHLRWLHLIIDSASGPPLPQLALANLAVFQPADAAEALDCLVLALRRAEGPSVMALSLRADATPLPAVPRLCARGAYLLHAPVTRDLTLLAAGAGVPVALAVRVLLARHGLEAAVVSMPCRALWDSQEESYRQAVLGTAPLAALAADALAFAGLTGVRDLIVGTRSWPPDPHVTVGAILRHLGRPVASRPLDEAAAPAQKTAPHAIIGKDKG